MTPETTCPLCNHPLLASERTCSSCGVDLALAAALAERAIVNTGSEWADPLPVSPEVLVPRLGERLVEEGLISEDQLRQALAYQAEQTAEGTPVRLGQALIRLGMVDAATLDLTITQQIFQLQDALRRSNRELENRVQERTWDLQQALSRLSEVNQLKANFIANISHELRTPLTHIKGYTELLSDASLGPITEDQTAAFEVMDRSILRLENLINDLIRFSQASQGEIALQVIPFPAGYLFRSVLSQITAKTSNLPLKVESHIEEGLPHLLADMNKTIWVVQHLVDNAIKFTPAGGRITLTAKREGDLARIAVTDTGIGIPATRISEIFEPFHQLEESSTRRFGGTGLGLALIKRILHAHQTDMQVESEVGKGSTFSFTLPISTLEPANHGPVAGEA